MSRPKLSDTERRQHRVVVWLTDDELVRLDAEVEARGLEGRGKQARADALRQAVFSPTPTRSPT